MRLMKLIRARHEQGLAAYRAGQGVDQVLETVNQIDEMHDQPGVSQEQHEEIANSIPSFFAGYLTGLIDDVRALASNPTIPPRRGPTA